MTSLTQKVLIRYKGQSSDVTIVGDTRMSIRLSTPVNVICRKKGRTVSYSIIMSYIDFTGIEK